MFYIQHILSIFFLLQMQKIDQLDELWTMWTDKMGEYW